MNAHSAKGPVIRKVDAWPVDIGLTDDFVISQGAISVAENVFIRITLDDGTEGYGEMAPFEELTGETRDDGLRQVRKLAEGITGRPVHEYERISAEMKEKEPGQPAPRCGLETAMLDAFCRFRKIPLWSLWCREPRTVLTTDVTIPLLSYDKSMELAGAWYASGFRTLKIKVGIDSDSESRLITDISRRYPDVSFIIDANMAFQPGEAIIFINDLARKGIPVLLFEQPNDRFDLEGMKEIKDSITVPLAADEAVFTREDAERVAAMGAADVINLKIMKSGVLETLEIIRVAVAAGLGLMIGGMVETRLAMGCSLALAQSFPAIRYLDLDTPLLMIEDPVVGGYRYDGSRIIGTNDPGLGMKVRDGMT
ncbi:MAG: dipeptide epimerase [Bacteroidales bacterium]|nr:dipeptide epimerase [Bacteroidales bacterium]